MTILTVNRPDVRNCIDAETAGAAVGRDEAFTADDQALVMVVTGAGEEAFCSGADLRDVETIVDRAGGTRRAPLGFSDHEPGKPRISAVEGWCIAGGIELACWCDFTVAGRGATFAAFSRRWGVPSVDGGTQRMTRGVGAGNALYLLESAEPIDASPAMAMGLVQEVVPTGRALPRAMELAERIAAFPQWSLRGDRRSVLDGIGLPLEGLGREATTGQAAENNELRSGVNRFVEGREGGAAEALHP